LLRAAPGPCAGTCRGPCRALSTGAPRSRAPRASRPPVLSAHRGLGQAGIQELGRTARSRRADKRVVRAVDADATLRSLSTA
jgi:hypothetical protein